MMNNILYLFSRIPPRYNQSLQMNILTYLTHGCQHHAMTCRNTDGLTDIRICIAWMVSVASRLIEETMQIRQP